MFTAPLTLAAPAPAPTTALVSRQTGRYPTRSRGLADPSLALPPARRQPRRQPPASSTANTAPTHQYPALVTYDLEPWTYYADRNRVNILNLTQLLRYGALAVGDELHCRVGIYTQRLRIIYLAQGGRVYLHRLDRAGNPGPPLVRSDGTPYFTAPDHIIAALSSNGQQAGAGLTAWNALEVLRGGSRVGTLGDIREDFRVRGSQQRPPPRAERTAIDTPAPTTGAEDTTETGGDGATALEGAGEAAEDEGDEMDVDSDSTGDTIPYPADNA